MSRLSPPGGNLANDEQTEPDDRRTPDDGVTSLADIPAELTEWLWPGRVPLGKVILVEGEPEAGKTSLVLDLAARLTMARPMPDLDPANLATFGPLGEVAKLAKLAELVPRNVLFMSAEDGASDTIKPRFLAAGGDPDRFFIQGEVDHYNDRDEKIDHALPTFPSMAYHLHATVAARDVSLVILDGLGSFLDRGMNPNNDPDMRKVLGALAKIAADAECTIVIIRHFNKSANGNAMNRGSGSIGITGMARVALQVTRHPDDDEERVLTVVKTNLTKKPPSLTYRIESTVIQGIPAPRVEWTGKSDITADELAAHSFRKATNPDDPSKADEARTFILETLADGPMWAKDLDDAAADAKHKSKTLQRARSALRESGQITTDRGAGNRSFWRLADDDREPTRD
jgi:hypothetical protein